MNRERKKYNFTEQDNPNQTPFGEKHPWVPAYGFWFLGDKERPKGLYDNEGYYYGDCDGFSESALMLDEYLRSRGRLAQGVLDLAALSKSPQSLGLVGKCLADAMNLGL